MNGPGVSELARFDEILTAAVREAEARGDTPGKIAMIKLLREQTGIGLRDAKMAVENYGSRNGVESLVHSTDGGTGLLALCLAALGGGLVVYLLLGR